MKVTPKNYNFKTKFTRATVTKKNIRTVRTNEPVWQNS